MRARIWSSRLLILAVAAWNIQAAAVLLLQTELISSGLDLDGPTGMAVTRGIGLLFLMWNIPYLVAAIHPIRHRFSLYEAFAMQLIGLVGEIVILLTTPNLSIAIVNTLNTYIYFDAAGLGLLVLAAYISRRTPSPGNVNITNS